MAKVQAKGNKSGEGSGVAVFREVDIASIVIEDQAMRHNLEDDAIIELGQDIAQKGLLQPIGVRPREDGTYQLLWGGRRLVAYKRLNRSSIMAHVWGDSEIPVKALALVENLQRVNLTLVEEVEAVNYLHHTEGKSPDQISSILSKGRSWIMRRLAIPNLPEDLRASVLEGDVPVGVAEEISRVPHDGFRKFLLSQAVAMHWSIKQTAAACEAYIKAIERGGAEGPTAPGGFDPPPPSTLYLTCAQCGGLKEEGDLALIRVCLGGCNPAEPESVDGSHIEKEA